MYGFRHTLFTLILSAASFCLQAQENELYLGLRAGHNAAFGTFAAVSLESDQSLSENFRINAGLRYNTIGKTAAESRPAYTYDFSWGRISAEALLACTNLSSVRSMSIGAGAGISGKWIGVKLGYYYRLYGGKAGYIKEPFNIYYELCADILPMIDSWDLQFLITNCEFLELERHYQPSFIAQSSYYMRHHLGLSMGIGCKPAGMFNMSADYYESYLKLGVCYRW